ncbi:DUF2190 family protein [Silvanigrella aquatica]|uniref:DUF2190 domain-containing protein n=1 Tax=Silvanigrella aquatica TaxID=1915309 RepID=A0A1L4D159_9BACT|nr:DUF2190 family protein [Silvanigrella aquatica]APJ03931.1 hypothetical protein AXG55_08445 [Silvanigrella aquatica]
MRISNYISPSDIILAKPPYDVTAGQLFNIEKLVLVAMTDGQSKWPISAYTQGCFEFAVTGEVKAGSPVYYLDGSLTTDSSDEKAIPCGVAYSQVNGLIWEVMLMNMPKHA